MPHLDAVATFLSAAHCSICSCNVMYNRSNTKAKFGDKGSPAIPLILMIFGWLMQLKNLASIEISIKPCSSFSRSFVGFSCFRAYRACLPPSSSRRQYWDMYFLISSVFRNNSTGKSVSSRTTSSFDVVFNTEFRSRDDVVPSASVFPFWGRVNVMSVISLTKQYAPFPSVSPRVNSCRSTR